MTRFNEKQMPVSVPIMEKVNGEYRLKPENGRPINLTSDILTSSDDDSLGIDENKLAEFIDARILASGGSTKPVPVTLLPDFTAKTLTASHPLGTSEIVMSINNGSYVPYAPINVGNVSRAAGYYKFKVKSASGRLESDVVESPAFTAESSGGDITKTAQIVFTDGDQLPTSPNWNAILNSALTSPKALILNDGTASGWTLTLARVGSGGSASESTGSTTPATAKFPVDVINKLVFFYAGQGFELTISGTDNSKLYNIYSQHSTGDGGVGVYGNTTLIVDGVAKTTELLTSTGIRTSMLSFEGVAPTDASLKIIGQLGPSQNLVCITAFIIEEIG